MSTEVTCAGISGVTYSFAVYDPRQTTWHNVPGVYLFAYLWQGSWIVLYVGQCESFRARMPSHERWPEAARRGATHVLALLHHGGEVARKAVERDIIASHTPLMNTQHQPV